MSNFRKALMATAIPIVTLSIFGAVGNAVGGRFGDPFFLLWWGATGLCVVGFLMAIVLYFMGKRDIAAGIAAGTAIGIVSLGVTCFASIAS